MVGHVRPESCSTNKSAINAGFQLVVYFPVEIVHGS